MMDTYDCEMAEGMGGLTPHGTAAPVVTTVGALSVHPPPSISIEKVD